MNYKILNIGSGFKKIKNAINLDISEEANPDVIHDFNVYPFPFQDCFFDKIVFEDGFILIDKPTEFIFEVYRLLKKNGKIFIKNPYFKSAAAYLDPNIKRHISVHHFDLYCKNTVLNSNYSKLYNLENLNFILDQIKFNEDINLKFLRKIISKLMLSIGNLSPSKYELYLSNIYPLISITHILKKV